MVQVIVNYKNTVKMFLRNSMKESTSLQPIIKFMTTETTNNIKRATWDNTEICYHEKNVDRQNNIILGIVVGFMIALSGVIYLVGMVMSS